MATEITSKSELIALATKLDSKSKEIVEAMNSISTTLKSVSSYDGIDVSSAANTLSGNLTNLSTDFTNASLNISNYAGLIEEFDTDDFDMGDTSSTNDAKVTLSQSTTSNDQATSSNQNNSNNVVYSGVTTGVISGSQTTTSSNAGKYYNSSNSNNTSSSNNSSTSSNLNSSGKINASGPVKITEGDPNNPDIDITKYSNYPEKGFEVTTGNLCYELSDEDIELLCAIVSAESDKTYDDALAVITTILNRCETDNWIRSHGTDPIAQATAPNQFVVYQHGSYKKYMNGNAPETVVQAVKDALAGVRNHKYLSFRSNGTTSYSDNMISPTGNRYK
jgi:hypothetical protein